MIPSFLHIFCFGWLVIVTCVIWGYDKRILKKKRRKKKKIEEEDDRRSKSRRPRDISVIFTFFKRAMQISFICNASSAARIDGFDAFLGDLEWPQWEGTKQSRMIKGASSSGRLWKPSYLEVDTWYSQSYKKSRPYSDHTINDTSPETSQKYKYCFKKRFRTRCVRTSPYFFIHHAPSDIDGIVISRECVAGLPYWR